MPHTISLTWDLLYKHIRRQFKVENLSKFFTTYKHAGRQENVENVTSILYPNYKPHFFFRGGTEMIRKTSSWNTLSRCHHSVGKKYFDSAKIIVTTNLQCNPNLYKMI